jgi:hypothetical protein
MSLRWFRLGDCALAIMLIASPTLAGGGGTFRFAWPASVSLAVWVSHTKEVHGLGASEAPFPVTHYDILATPSGAGRRLEFKPNMMIVSGHVSNLISPPIPTVELGRRGDVVRVELGVEVRDFIARSLGSKVKQGNAQVLELAEKAYEQQATAEWVILVSRWVGKTYSFGLTRKSTEVMAVNVVPGQPASEVTSDVATTFDGPVPCEEKEEPRCVRVAVTFVPEQAAMRLVQRDLLRATGNKDLVMDQWEIHSERRHELITEPGTLLPHRLTTIQKISMKGTEEGKAVNVTSTATDEYVFRMR